MDEVYEIAALDEASRDARVEDALSRLWEAQHEVAQAKTGCAIALLRELAPDAAEVRFEVSDSDHGGKYAVVYLIGGRQADQVLFDLDADEKANLDYDDLSPVEDYLAGAAEVGGKFDRDPVTGNLVLRLVP